MSIERRSTGIAVSHLSLGTQMSNNSLCGPFRLTFEGIACAVARRSAGVYVLGNTSAGGRFMVQNVGRADVDLKAKLQDQIGSATQFKYLYTDTSRAAFEKECELFHAMRPPSNRVHPDRANGTRWECPRCRIYHR